MPPFLGRATAFVCAWSMDGASMTPTGWPESLHVHEASTIRTPTPTQLWRLLAEGHEVEVWERTRFVRRLPDPTSKL
jgi:hypothetical protein